jgi:hypothetical protein
MKPCGPVFVLDYSFLQQSTTAARLHAEVAQDIAMQIQSHPKPAKALRRPMRCKPDVNTTDATWKPQEVGLTRQELRDIVIDLIG